MSNETPEQTIAQDFNIIADELPADYAELATAMASHANAATPSTRKNLATALAKTLIAAPPELLNCISENLQQVNKPREPEADRLSYNTPAASATPTWPTTEPPVQIFIDSNARMNELDDTFWRTMLWESSPALHQNESKHLEFESYPIKVLIELTTINVETALIRMTAISQTSTGDSPIGEAIIIDSLTSMF